MGIGLSDDHVELTATVRIRNIAGVRGMMEGRSFPRAGAPAWYGSVFWVV